MRLLRYLNRITVHLKLHQVNPKSEGISDIDYVDSYSWDDSSIYIVPEAPLKIIENSSSADFCTRKTILIY